MHDAEFRDDSLRSIGEAWRSTTSKEESFAKKAQFKEALYIKFSFYYD